MDNVAHLKNLYAAFGRGEIPTIMEAMDPDIRWYEAESNPYTPEGGPFKGPDEVVNKLFARLAEEWDGYTVTPETFHDAGDTVIIEGRYKGTFKQTGREYDAQFCHIWWLENGKVKKFQQYTDTAAIQEAMGVASAVG